jgi:hypothetical protein
MRLRRPSLVGPLGVSLAICLTVACGISPFDTPQAQINVQPNGVFTGQQMSHAEAQSLIAKQSTQVSPVLFPTYISDGLNVCAASGAKDTFNVQCYGGPSTVSLTTQTENPAEYKPKVIQHLKFRSDASATFVDVDPANAGAVRFILWIEPGKSADKICGCVHYDMHANGVSAAELWKIANSLEVAKNAS